MIRPCLTAFLVCAAPLVLAGPTGLVITEIMYHPVGDEAELEFLEIHNAGTVIYDISG